MELFGRTGLGAMVRGVIVASVFSSLALSAIDAGAQAFPSRRVTIIVPFTTGGIVDYFARLLAPRLTERFGQPVVVDNRPSVSGNVGATAGARAVPDGYTITFLLTTNLMASMIAAELPFDMEKDFAPVTQMAAYHSILVVKPSVPAKNMAELIALTKAKPGELNYGTSGVGSSAHIGMALLAEATGINVLVVPYKGEGPVITALLTGELDMAQISTGGAEALVKAGKLRAIGVTAKTRSAQYPDVPAIAETVPGFEHTGWIGVLVPAGTPRDRIDLLYREFNATLRTPEVRQNLAGRSVEVVASTPDEFRQHIHADAERMRKLVKKLGLKKE